MNQEEAGYRVPQLGTEKVIGKYRIQYSPEANNLSIDDTIALERIQETDSIAQLAKFLGKMIVQIVDTETGLEVPLGTVPVRLAYDMVANIPSFN